MKTIVFKQEKNPAKLVRILIAGLLLIVLSATVIPFGLIGGIQRAQANNSDPVIIGFISWVDIDNWGHGATLNSNPNLNYLLILSAHMSYQTR